MKWLHEYPYMPPGMPWRVVELDPCSVGVVVESTTSTESFPEGTLFLIFRPPGVVVGDLILPSGKILSDY